MPVILNGLGNVVPYYNVAIKSRVDGQLQEIRYNEGDFVKEGQLLTPPLSAGALYGITRHVVLEIAREAGLEAAEANLTRYDVFNADECFLTGSGAELVPVVKVDGRVIGAGKPGPLTNDLVTRYHSLTKVSGEPIYD